MRDILDECVRALEAVQEAVANHQAAGLVRSALEHGKAELSRPEEKPEPVVVLAKPEEKPEPVVEVKPEETPAVREWIRQAVDVKPVSDKSKKKVHKKR